MTKEPHNNTYAFNLKGEEKHISDVVRGRKGYYCMGCNAQVEAVKGEIRNHYFRHIPTDVNIERKCTYSDETYRHKIAKEILQKIKKIKVPALYKYSPTTLDGRAMKIRDAWTIEAQTVKIERQFYENKEGGICFGEKIDFTKDKEKFLLIQPDVAFFDKKDNPILLIEIVATHKIDPVKMSKIRRLGIDTIQVTIPKDSPEAIEDCFFRTHRTQWIYNYEQERTSYIFVPKGDNKGIPPIDEFQRKLSKAAESYSCRSAQISNLIRGLRKCLESQQYRKIEQSTRGELDRVEGNTKRDTERLLALQTKYRKEIKREFEPREKVFNEEKDGFKREERRFRDKVEDLERRYSTKREELEIAQEKYKPDCQSEIRRIEQYLGKLGTDRASFEEQIAELEEQENQFEQHIREEQKRIAEFTREEQDRFNDLSTRRKELQIENERVEAELREQFRGRKRRIKQEFRDFEAELRREFEELGAEAIEAIERKDSSGKSRIHRRIEETVDRGKILSSIREGKSGIQTLQRAKELYESGAYKSWNGTR